MPGTTCRSTVVMVGASHAGRRRSRVGRIRRRLRKLRPRGRTDLGLEGLPAGTCVASVVSPGALEIRQDLQAAIVHSSARRSHRWPCATIPTSGVVLAVYAVRHSCASRRSTSRSTTTSAADTAAAVRAAHARTRPNGTSLSRAVGGACPVALWKPAVSVVRTAHVAADCSMVTLAVRNSLFMIDRSNLASESSCCLQWLVAVVTLLESAQGFVEARLLGSGGETGVSV
jgi:hypothetical protein